jgi:WXXGXW repeat (2 copies)
MNKFNFKAIIPVLMLLSVPALSNAAISVGLSITLAPPALPVYVQPPIPGDGYVWTPGYWAWGGDDYYWVPGTWVLAPTVGYLWTPGYWGWGGGYYAWHTGYWGPHVGFYGGVNYGFGYGGIGYEGGYWRDNHLYYNRTVNNFGSTRISNVYNRTVINNVTVNRVSYNGGNGGIHAQASSAELLAEHDHHIAVTADQRSHEHMARADRSLRASVNGGRPAIAATPRPGAFRDPGVVGTRHSERATLHNDRPPGAGQSHQRPLGEPHMQSAPQMHNEQHTQGAPQMHNAPQTHNAPQGQGQPRDHRGGPEGERDHR